MASQSKENCIPCLFKCYAEVVIPGIAERGLWQQRQVRFSLGQENSNVQQQPEALRLRSGRKLFTFMPFGSTSLTTKGGAVHRDDG